jgi:hypothetical protein
VAAFSISASFFALFLYTTLYLQNILGLSAIEAGLVYMPVTLVMFVVAGTGIFNPAVSAVALGSAPQHMSGLAAGVNDTFRQAGIAVGVAAFGAMVPSSAALGAGDPAACVDGLHTALLAGAVLDAAGALASARLLGLGRASGAATPQPA